MQHVELSLPTGEVDRPEWLGVSACPSCGADGDRIGRIFVQSFRASADHFIKPPVPRTLVRCVQCSLVYKDLVPSPQCLPQLSLGGDDLLWTDDYKYEPELALIESCFPAQNYDLLDIGAAGGGLLKASRTSGRRSALDIVPFGRLETKGEFIRGFLETADLKWSGTQYHVVTAFDVFEHLYDPVVAMANLRRFVRDDGLIIVETGDSDALPSRRLPHWSYINVVEHHLAWNERSLARLAELSGLRIVAFQRKRHKLAEARSTSWRGMLKYMAFRLSPAAYAALYKMLDRPAFVPNNPLTADHFRAVLKPVRG